MRSAILRWSPLIVSAAAFVLAAALWVRYCSTFFFLFDDFALVGDASSHSVWQVVTEPLVGFYRPAMFLLVKIEERLFGWALPAGYLAVSYSIHLANAGLLYRLSQQMGGSQQTSTIAAVLFVWSPWSSEAQAWPSAGFDVLATFGMLACVLAGLRCRTTATPGRGIAIATAGILAAALALLSKESAVVVPLIAATSLVFVRSPENSRHRLAWLYVGSLAVVTGAYFILRSRILGGLGGAYGSAFELFRDAHLLDNAFHYVRAFITIPFPGVRPGTMPPTWAVFPAAVTGLGLVWCALRASPRTAILALTSFALAITPTLWATAPTGSSAAGRFLYFPGVWVCLIAAAGIGSLTAAVNRTPFVWARAAMTAATAAMYGLLLVSVGYQFSSWRAATLMSRSSVEQFRPLLTRGASKVFIPNLPFWFTEGPYVLKDYAFSYYFEGQSVPIVRTRNMVLSRENGRIRFAGWTEGETAPAGKDEVVLRLALPIDGTPAPMTVSPETLSVLVSSRNLKSSGATVVLDAPEGGDWNIESPAPELFSVEPRRGNGSTVLRIVPRAADTALDRTVVVPVYAGLDDHLHTLAAMTIRFKATSATGATPPFGFVDLPPDPIVLGNDAIVLQGWALDDLSLRRIWADAVDQGGQSRTIAERATRGGERPDVSKLFPNAHDLLNASWAIAINPGVLSQLKATKINVLAEDADGNRAVIGTRAVR